MPDSPYSLKRLAVVPAYNEASAVQDVVLAIRAVDPGLDVLVIDDGSTDDTAAVARAAGARVARLPVNLGIGSAVQTGYRLAWEEGYELAVQIDGDGQHPPGELPRLMETLTATGANYVIGSRFASAGEHPGPVRAPRAPETASRTSGRYRGSRSRRGAIAVLSRLVSAIVGQRLTDTTSGYRVADRRTIRLFATHYPHDYPEVEAIVLAHRSGLTIAETLVRMRARETGTSSITPLRSGYYMVKVLLAVLIQCMGRNPARRRANGPPEVAAP